MFDKSNQPRYALTVIDRFHKYGDAQPMNNKDNNSVNEALKSFKIMKYPMGINPDDDGASKAKVKELFDGEGKMDITTLTHANVVGSLIRTIKKELMRAFNLTKVIGLTC